LFCPFQAAFAGGEMEQGGAVRKRRVEAESPPSQSGRPEAAARRPEPAVTEPEDTVVVVRRRERDSGDRLRRGSLKSRIFQFKKRKKEPAAPPPPLAVPSEQAAGAAREVSDLYRRREPAVVLADQDDPPVKGVRHESGAPSQLLLKVVGSEGEGADGGVAQQEGHQQHLFHQQQPGQQQAAYPRYPRLTNGAQHQANGGQTPANGSGASFAGGQRPANGGDASVAGGREAAAASLRPGRPTALQLLPAGDPAQQQRFIRDHHSSLASSVCSLASPSPPPRGLTTPSRGPATPTPKGPGRHASPPPPSRDVEVVFRRRVSQPPTRPSPQVVYILKIHCKKRLAVFPSPAGMSRTKLSQARNN
jgi:hypothetical protein